MTNVGEKQVRQAIMKNPKQKISGTTAKIKISMKMMREDLKMKNKDQYASKR